jgi:hypothetical protein
MHYVPVNLSPSCVFHTVCTLCWYFHIRASQSPIVHRGYPPQEVTGNHLNHTARERERGWEPNLDIFTNCPITTIASVRLLFCSRSIETTVMVLPRLRPYYLTHTHPPLKPYHPKRRNLLYV